MVLERDLSKFSPSELNSELASICLQFPTSITNYPSTSHNPNDLLGDPRYVEVARRRQSEHKEVLINAIAQLLIYSPTTRPFKLHAFEMLSYTYDYGLKMHAYFIDPAGEIGIFAHPRAKIIECNELNRRVEISLLVKDFRGKSKNIPYDEVQNNYDLFVWRQEYVKKYGEEP